MTKNLIWAPFNTHITTKRKVIPFNNAKLHLHTKSLPLVALLPCFAI